MEHQADAHLIYSSENYETCSTQSLELKSLHLAQAYNQPRSFVVLGRMESSSLFDGEKRRIFQYRVIQHIDSPL
jgi:hypothetical protein